MSYYTENKNAELQNLMNKTYTKFRLHYYIGIITPTNQNGERDFIIDFTYLGEREKNILCQLLTQEGYEYQVDESRRAISVATANSKINEEYAQNCIKNFLAKITLEDEEIYQNLNERFDSLEDLSNFIESYIDYGSKKLLQEIINNQNVQNIYSLCSLQIDAVQLYKQLNNQVNVFNPDLIDNLENSLEIQRQQIEIHRQEIGRNKEPWLNLVERNEDLISILATQIEERVNLLNLESTDSVNRNVEMTAVENRNISRYKSEENLKQQNTEEGQQKTNRRNTL